MELGLAGRTAAVTGGSRGIGRAVAEELAAEGCHLRLAARSADDLRAAAAAISGRYGVDVSVHPGDLTDSAAVAAFGEACREVDILVNNAGSVPQGSLTDIDEATWRHAWDLKVFSYINLTRAIYPAMCARGRGVIVNVIGIGGERPDANYIAGSSGNAALMMFSRSLGGEAIRHGVRVVAVNPGPTETEKYIGDAERRAAEQLGDKTRWRELTARLPMGRASTTAEVSAMVAFLASDRCSYISGSIVSIDGGILGDARLGVKRG